MENVLKKRIKKIGDMVQDMKEIIPAVVILPKGYSQADVDRGYQDYLNKGGNPNIPFIMMIKDYFFDFGGFFSVCSSHWIRINRIRFDKGRCSSWAIFSSFFLRSSGIRNAIKSIIIIYLILI